MECDCSSHPIHEDFHSTASSLLEQEHHAASVQFEKYLEGMFCAEFRNYSTTATEVLKDLLLLGCEELGGLSVPRPRDT